MTPCAALPLAEPQARERHVAHLETLCSHAAIARVYELPEVPPDGAYCWCCTIATAGWLATLKGMRSTPTPAIRAALYAALRDAGFRAIRYERRSGANPGWRTHEL